MYQVLAVGFTYSLTSSGNVSNAFPCICVISLLFNVSSRNLSSPLKACLGMVLMWLLFKPRVIRASSPLKAPSMSSMVEEILLLFRSLKNARKIQS